MQTTIKAMKRVAEIKQKRERAFWKHRMAVAREKHRDARRRAKEKLYAREQARDAVIAASYVDEELDIEKEATEDPLELVQPISTSSKEKIKVKEKILVTNSKRPQRQSALVSGEGRNMGMELD